MGKVINHWGKWIDSDIPGTGVINSDNVMWEWVNDEICLTCEEIQSEIENDESIEDKESEIDFIECDSSHTRIFGDWIYDTQTGQYTPDKNGEFSAIENESTVQIVWSKYTKRGNVCSPCYPGQIDLDSDGEFLAYTLPDNLLYNYDEDMKG